MFEVRFTSFATRLSALILSFALGYQYNTLKMSFSGKRGTLPSVGSAYPIAGHFSTNFPRIYTRDPSTVLRYDLHNIYTSSSSNTYQKALQNNQCGLILFVHINKCGGGSLARWFKHHATGKHHAAGYLLLEDTSTYKGVTNVSLTRVSWQSMVTKATSFVSKKIK